MRIPKIKFVFDRRKRANSKKKGSVELRIGTSTRQYFGTTGVRCLPKQWDERTESVVYSPDAAYLNQILTAIRMKVTDMIAQQVKEGFIDAPSLLRVLDSDKPDMSLYEFISTKIAESHNKERTILSFKAFLTVLKEFDHIKYFNDATEKNITAYDEWLHNRGYKQATVWAHHKRLKKFINMAIVDGYMKENPYKTHHIHIDKGEAEQIDCVSHFKLDKIRHLELEEGYMTRTRDLFLFQCYTGMAYSDMQSFCLSDFTKGEDGIWLIKRERIKTGVRYSIVLTKAALEIVNKYGGQLPKISNQKYNLYLKAIGQMVGISRLHSHMGRATFATIMLNKGIPLDIVAKMVGHTNTSQTKRYATIQDETIKQAFRMA